jgi:MarR family transcriptional regulator for hemolysin
MSTVSLIKKANCFLVKKANELLKPYNIPHAYTFFLMELHKQDGLTQSEIHKSIGIEQPTAVRTLDRMERDGFVTRERSSTDRRATLIKLTKKGKECESIIKKCSKQLNDLALAGIAKEERLLINILINRIVENVKL